MDRGAVLFQPGSLESFLLEDTTLCVATGVMTAQTDAAIDSAGWMHTGDLAVMDDDGYFQIVGRIKDMVIRGGENIYPAEIEGSPREKYLQDRNRAGFWCARSKIRRRALRMDKPKGRTNVLRRRNTGLLQRANRTL